MYSELEEWLTLSNDMIYEMNEVDKIFNKSNIPIKNINVLESFIRKINLLEEMFSTSIEHSLHNSYLLNLIYNYLVYMLQIQDNYIDKIFDDNVKFTRFLLGGFEQDIDNLKEVNSNLINLFDDFNIDEASYMKKVLVHYINNLNTEPELDSFSKNLLNLENEFKILDRENIYNEIQLDIKNKIYEKKKELKLFACLDSLIACERSIKKR